MSPGASWAPFEMAEADKPDRRRLAALARYHDREFALDPEFDHHTDYVEWLRAVCAKHRSAYHQQLAKRRRQPRRP